MADRRDVLDRLLRRVRLPPALATEVERAVLETDARVEDILLHIGFDASEAGRIANDDPATDGRPRESAVVDHTLADEEGGARPRQVSPVDEPSVDDLVGRLMDVTDRYELQGEIARGAMGRILAAWDRHLGRPVAVKVLRKSSLRDLDRVRFLEEAQVTGQLQHPSIVPVYELARIGDQVAFVMRRIEGRSLKDIIAALRRGDADVVSKFGRLRILTIFHQLCLVTAFAHRRGVVHRDLKPSNVMVGDFGEVLLLDWGLCKIIGEATRSTRSLSDRWRTMHGQIIGTPAYMAPEQALGLVDEIDARTDVYGLGSILYHLLTLRPPVVGKTNRELVEKVVRERITPPVERAPEQDIPEQLSAIVMRCMARAQADRYVDALELAAVVQDYLDGPMVSGRTSERLVQNERAADASALVAAAKVAVAHQQSLLEDIALARDEMLAASNHDRGQVWAAESRLCELEGESAEAAARATGLLTRAVAADSSHVEARQMLCEQLAVQYERALEHGDPSTSAMLRRLLAEHDDGRHAALVAGAGAVHVEVLPKGAQVWIWPHEERGRRLVPGEVRDIGDSPAKVDVLDAGVYGLSAQAPGWAAVLTSFRVVPGQTTRLKLRLVPEGTVPAELVHIPGGTFRYGPSGMANGGPTEAALPDFAVAREPVTLGEYVDFVRDVGRRAPDEALALVPRAVDGRHPAWHLDARGLWRLTEGTAWHASQPVTGVTLHGARAYARWAAVRDGRPMRLPTEEEWEKAARGPEGRAFPWGERWEPTFCDGPETWSGPSPPPVSHAPLDISPFGVMGTAGGVREWTDTREQAAPLGVVRGGSFLAGAQGSRPLWVREVVPAEIFAPDLGFRLAVDLATAQYH